MHEPSCTVWKADVRVAVWLDNHTVAGMIFVAYNL
jgi:hypothetical protein